MILYPGPRSVANSSLAFHLLKGFLASRGVGLVYGFMEDGELIVRGKGLEDVRIILVSLPYELMYVDLVRALDALGLEVFSGRRSDSDPIIVAGGPAVTANPLPVLDIVDAVLVGEAEPVLERIADSLSNGRGRKEALKELAGIEGLLVPGYSELPVRRVYVERLDDAWYPLLQEPIDGVEPVWGRAFILETTRGCGRSCRFCMEGTIFRPKRDRSYARLKGLLEEGIRLNRVRKVSFYSLIFFDNRASDAILRDAVEGGLEVSVPSIRTETLTFERARLIASGGQKTITIAPETGSCLIAKAILKPIGKDITLWALENAFEAGIKSAKFYIMIGFPGESMSDVEATLSMVRDAAQLARKYGGRIKLSINPFMPKPVTGMQWAGLEDVKTLRRKIDYLVKPARRMGVQVSVYDPRWARIQVALARSGREASRLIVAWARKGGSAGAYRSALAELGLSDKHYLEEWPLEVDPPWHSYVEHPFAELWRLRRDWAIYKNVIESRGKLSKLRIKGCDS